MEKTHCPNCQTPMPFTPAEAPERLSTCESCGVLCCYRCTYLKKCKDCFMQNAKHKEVTTYFREKSSMIPSILSIMLLILMLPLSVATSKHLATFSYQNESMTHDTYVWSGSDGQNFGTSQHLVYGTYLGTYFNALINLNETVRTLPSEVTITNVVLTFHINNAYNAGTINLVPMNKSWDESNVTWTNIENGCANLACRNDSFVIGNFNDSLLVDGQYFNVTLNTSYFQRLLSEPTWEWNKGIVIYSTDAVPSADTQSYVSSSDDPTADERPILYINYSVIDDMPPNITGPANQSLYYDPALFLSAIIQDDFPLNASWECASFSQKYNLSQSPQSINATFFFNSTQSCIITATDTGNNTASSTFTLTLIPPVPDGAFTVGVCPAAGTERYSYALLVFMLLIFYVLSHIYIRIPVISVVFGAGIFVSGVPLLSCSIPLGLGMMMFGGAAMVAEFFD